MKNYIIKRELRGSGYRWEMRGNKIAIMDTKQNVEVVLTKVGAMSLIKFLPNYFDKMRIEDNKALRAQMAKMREKAKAQRENEKAKREALKNKQQLRLLSTKAKII